MTYEYDVKNVVEGKSENSKKQELTNMQDVVARVMESTNT